MSAELRVPQLGESITEAVVGKWNKNVGDSVAADEPVVVLETDKVTVDVAAPSAGALSNIAFPTGAKVRIGDLLGTIDTAKAGAVAKPAASQPPAAQAQATQVAPAFAPASNGVEQKQPSPTPVARNVAAGMGVDTRQIQGSGTGGRVMKDDVVRAGAAGAAQGPVVPVAARSTVAGAREERVRMTPLRKRVAERLLQAQSTAAILTTFNEVDMGEVMTLRKQYGDKFQTKHGVKLGFMGFFVKAVIEALKTFPAVNASIDGEDVVFHHYYDIGVAVSGSRGLVVPVVRDADTMSMADLEKTIAELGTKAKNDKLTLNDLQGGTFTLSNGGIFGSMLSTPILNPPQTGILGMHNIVDRPVVRDGQIVVRPVMFLALSYDHRLIDGREAVQFLVRVKDCIEAPERMLLDI
ncbi:MAG: 2-oxoglutarate dehydrogenase complex dihydrolipoyllysine-residue succinyltransferase [Myxococcaceae bacterium]|nr:2-oxoglutarate dehydrogenase complex dihydrolipoyllysine-residue succinyltransferase [Myxococcaceae bacterium]